MERVALRTTEIIVEDTKRNGFTLARKNGKVLLRFTDDEAETPVRVVWARPLTGRGREVSFLDEKKKKEVAMTLSLDDLDRKSREIAQQEIYTRYLLPRITQVLKTRTHFGTRFWEVQTDRGPKNFAVKCYAQRTCTMPKSVQVPPQIQSRGTKKTCLGFVVQRQV